MAPRALRTTRQTSAQSEGGSVWHPALQVALFPPRWNSMAPAPLLLVRRSVKRPSWSMSRSTAPSFTGGEQGWPFFQVLGASSQKPARSRPLSWRPSP